ncbi:unnamed protein product, partial [Amoebophrya sp. A25]
AIDFCESNFDPNELYLVAIPKVAYEAESVASYRARVALLQTDNQPQKLVAGWSPTADETLVFGTTGAVTRTELDFELNSGGIGPQRREQSGVIGSRYPNRRFLYRWNDVDDRSRLHADTTRKQTHQLLAEQQRQGEDQNQIEDQRLTATEWHQVIEEFGSTLRQYAATARWDDGVRKFAGKLEKSLLVHASVAEKEAVAGQQSGFGTPTTPMLYGSPSDHFDSDFTPRAGSASGVSRFRVRAPMLRNQLSQDSPTVANNSSVTVTTNTTTTPPASTTSSTTAASTTTDEVVPSATRRVPAGAELGELSG